MRHVIPIITFLTVTALAVSCTSRGDKSPIESEASETATARLDEAKTATQEAGQSMQDYTYAQKTEFVDSMKKELAQMQEEMDRLSAKVASSSTATKDAAKTQLDAVREKWAQAKAQLDQAGNSTESTWDDVKGGFNQSYSELKDSFNEARQWLSDRIDA